VVRGGRGAGGPGGATVTGYVVAGVKTLVGGGVSGGVAGVSSLGATSLGVDTLGTSVKLVVALVVAAEDTALLLELVDAHGRQMGGAVVLSGVVVHFVDGNGCVYNLGLDDFLLDDWLDGLVDVAVVPVLVLILWCFV